MSHNNISDWLENFNFWLVVFHQLQTGYLKFSHQHLFINYFLQFLSPEKSIFPGFSFSRPRLYWQFNWDVKVTSKIPHFWMDSVLIHTKSITVLQFRYSNRSMWWDLWDFNCLYHALYLLIYCFRSQKPSHTHTCMQISNSSTSAKPVMTKLQNFFVALVNMYIFQMTLKFILHN